MPNDSSPIAPSGAETLRQRLRERLHTTEAVKDCIARLKKMLGPQGNLLGVYGMLEAYAESLLFIQPDQASDAATVARITAIVREADATFQKGGGGSRDWVRENFLPLLNAHGWTLVPAADALAVAAQEPQGWQPMETCLRQRDERVLLTDGVTVVLSHWLEHSAHFAGFYQNEPLAWMPLPAPPVAPTGENR